MRRYAAWVIGTAVQNNPKAQRHLLQYKGIKRLIEKLGDEYPVRAKALYALSCALAHFPDGVKQFNEANGWKALRDSMEGVDEGVECQRRVAFFISNHLAEDDPCTKEIDEHGFLEGMVKILNDERYASEDDLLEKVLLLFDLG